MNMRTKLPFEGQPATLEEKVDKLLQLLGDSSIAEAGHDPVASQTRIALVGAREARAVRPSPPEPRLLRRIIRHRQLRSKYFDSNLFADPAWDMLLDLAAARQEERRVSVTSLCIASQVPPTTALRWINQMVEQGVFVRVGDIADRRRAFIRLSEASADAMARYFAETGMDAHR